MVKNKIINLGDPTDATDAIDKQYQKNLMLNPAITIINSSTY